MPFSGSSALNGVNPNKKKNFNNTFLTPMEDCYRKGIYKNINYDWPFMYIFRICHGNKDNYEEFM